MYATFSAEKVPTNCAFLMPFGIHIKEINTLGSNDISMSRYKGRANPQAIEQAYPHIVEMIVPLGGFGTKLDDMCEWHGARDIEAMRGCG
jgi:hypothetical protein